MRSLRSPGVSGTHSPPYSSYLLDTAQSQQIVLYTFLTSSRTESPPSRGLARNRTTRGGDAPAAPRARLTVNPDGPCAVAHAGAAVSSLSDAGSFFCWVMAIGLAARCRHCSKASVYMCVFALVCVCVCVSTSLSLVGEVIRFDMR